MFRRLVPWLLVGATAFAFSVTFQQAAIIESARPDLVGAAAPRGLLSLQFARDAAHAEAILSQWAVAQPSPVTDLARQTIGVGDAYVLAYVSASALLLLWAAAVARPSKIFVGGVLLCLIAGGGLDRVENTALRTIVDSAGSVRDDDVGRARDAAIGKFTLLLVAGVGIGIAIGAALRRMLGPLSDPRSQEYRSFDALISTETAGLFPGPDRPADTPVVRLHAAADEPRVAFRAADVIGLALSGGGIRSATFNLGLLEGLHRRNLLPMFDYVATVSGGGYTGAFWSDWLARRQSSGTGTDANLFPSSRGGGPGDYDHVDSPQERHLREFARFLAPRWGFFEIETWTAVVALLSGLIPALAIGLAVIGFALVLWLGLTFPLALGSSQHASTILIVVVTTLAMYVFERMWYDVKTESGGRTRIQGQRGARWREWLRFLVFAAPAVALVGAAQWLLPIAYQHFGHEVPVIVDWRVVDVRPSGSLSRWWWLTGIDRAAFGRQFVFSPRLFDYTAVWLGVSFVLLLVRLAQPLSLVHWSKTTAAAYDRVLTRLLGLGVLWAVITLIWHLIVNTEQVAMLVAAAAASGGTFAALRNWIGVALRSDGASRLDRLKPYLPQLLAYLTIVLLAVAMGRLLIEVGDTDWLRWWTATGAMMLVLAMALFIDTAQYGLHAFYRDRLTRAFTGASNLQPGEGASDNRSADARDGDDRPLSQLVDRPLHLVCCAANDLIGDTVETLGRGARSAVLSKHGFTVGNHSAPTPGLQLGSAMTASAAAFNSNMGMVSMRVGPAVSFLMTALNLRLGLWVRHPAARTGGSRRWPGLLLYREMFGLTSASGPVPAEAVPSLMRDVHLSDGGHFENLALYELVRRHCRYILISDCGSDPSVAFDDLGNALRRVREDFGVDITLDVEPLRPAGATGAAAQHVAIGTIHYSSTDLGILLYVKPALTGDEPPDVLQYKTRNVVFPHETTGDQFYDEAQYESYRRLGLHAAEQVFDFVPPSPAAEPAAGGGAVSRAQTVAARHLTADWVFAEAAQRWGPTPQGLVESILAMTGRFGELEMELHRQSRLGIIREVFPELASLPPDVAGGTPAPVPDGLNTDPADLPFFIRATQVMEDAWMACRLDQWWDHPLNLGWVNLFARWATAPTFRFWWPLLSPMYSPGFRSFIDERFPIRTPQPNTTRDPSPTNISQRGRVVPLDTAPGHTPGLTEIWWKARSAQPCVWEHRTVYQNLVALQRPDDSPVDIQIGLAAVTIGKDVEADRDAGWTSHDFFVPPSLWGAGYGWYFLTGLLNELSDRQLGDCYVVVKAVPHDSQHQIALDDHRSFIEQYRKVGFRQQDTTLALDDGSANLALLRRMGFKPAEDILFRMDLARWSRRRGAVHV